MQKRRQLKIIPHNRIGQWGNSIEHLTALEECPEVCASRNLLTKSKSNCNWAMKRMNLETAVGRLGIVAKSLF